MARRSPILGLAAIVTLYFLGNLKTYRFSIPKFFIPKLPTGTDEQTDIVSIAKAVYNAVDISLTTKPKLGFILRLKPIMGVEIPFSVWLPITAPLAMPQLYLQLKKKLKIEPFYVGNMLLGYWVEAKDIEVVM